MRKIITAVVAILGAVGAYFAAEAGVVSGFGAALAGLGVALTFILFEARADIKNVVSGLVQSNKFKDPAFYTGLFGTVALELSAIFGWNIPVEILTPVLLLVIPILIKFFRKTE